MAGYSPTLTISSRKARNTPAHSRTPHRQADRHTHTSTPHAPPPVTTRWPRRGRRPPTLPAAQAGTGSGWKPTTSFSSDGRRGALPYPTLPYPERPPRPTLGEERVRSAATHLPNFPQPARALRPPARPHPASSRRQPMVEIPPESAIGLQAREGGEKFEERAMLIGRRVGGTA